MKRPPLFPALLFLLMALGCSVGLARPAWFKLDAAAVVFLALAVNTNWACICIIVHMHGVAWGRFIERALLDQAAQEIHKELTERGMATFVDDDRTHLGRVWHRPGAKDEPRNPSRHGDMTGLDDQTEM